MERIARITVIAVHPQYGGWTLWIRVGGAAVAFKVARGGKTAARHETRVAEGDLERLEEKLEAAKFWSLPPPTLKSLPMPDETWVEISAKAQSGVKASVGKFARQKSPLFDPIHKDLAAIAEQAWKSPAVWESAYDPYSSPSGF